MPREDAAVDLVILDNQDVERSLKNWWRLGLLLTDFAVRGASRNLEEVAERFQRVDQIVSNSNPREKGRAARTAALVDNRLDLDAAVHDLQWN